MRTKDLIVALGGPTAVARALGLTASAVTNWQMREEIPRSHSLDIWRIALKAGLDWTPPDATEIEHLLASRRGKSDPSALQSIESAA